MENEDIMKDSSKKRENPSTVEGYLAGLPEEDRGLLEDLRMNIRLIVPDSVEVISYQIPTVRYQNRGLVAYSAHKKHCSLHLMSLSVMSEFKDELKQYTTTKASIHFTTSKPLPVQLLKRLIKARVDENDRRKKETQK